MRPSKPHRFTAWLFDSYVLGILLGAGVALLLSLLRRPGSLPLGFGLFGASIIASTVYHLLLSTRVSGLSPGEMIAGRFVRDGTKIWLNPYSKTRWPVFAVLLVTVLMASNTWDFISDGIVVSVGPVLGRGLVVLTIVYCLVLAGRGRPKALFIIAAYWLVMALGALGIPTALAEAVAVALILASPGLLALVLGVLYSRWRVVAEAPVAG